MDILHPVEASNMSEIPVKNEHEQASHAIVHQSQQPAGLQAAPLHGGPMTYGLGKNLLSNQLILFSYRLYFVNPSVFQN